MNVPNYCILKYDYISNCVCTMEIQLLGTDRVFTINQVTFCLL